MRFQQYEGPMPMNIFQRYPNFYAKEGQVVYTHSGIRKYLNPNRPLGFEYRKGRVVCVDHADGVSGRFTVWNNGCENPRSLNLLPHTRIVLMGDRYMSIPFRWAPTLSDLKDKRGWVGSVWVSSNWNPNESGVSTKDGVHFIYNHTTESVVYIGDNPQNCRWWLEKQQKQYNN